MEEKWDEHSGLYMVLIYNIAVLGLPDSCVARKQWDKYTDQQSNTHEIILEQPTCAT
jgi:hypothetical protein